MAHPFHHSLSSVKKWGGVVDDYMPLHEWFDESKMILADFRHRALRHHAEGIFMLERIFGKTITLSTCVKCGEVKAEHDKGKITPIESLGVVALVRDHVFVPKVIPTRWVGEQHVQEDLGRIPSFADYARKIEAEPWMNRSRPLSRELEKQETSV